MVYTQEIFDNIVPDLIIAFKEVLEAAEKLRKVNTRLARAELSCNADFIWADRYHLVHLDSCLRAPDELSNKALAFFLEWLDAYNECYYTKRGRDFGLTKSFVHLSRGRGIKKLIAALEEHKAIIDGLRK